MSKEERLRATLEALCANAYWYGEETGDYDMSWIHEEPFFAEACDAILALVLEGNRDD